MNNLQKRFLLFLGGCIPSRLALTALAKYMPNKYLPYLGLITLLMALGFLYLYFTGARKVGPETFGQPIWWNKFRIIHGILYLLFSFYAINRYASAYLFLLYDTLIGLTLFLGHHYSVGDFNKLY
jgi:hypothetical protein